MMNFNEQENEEERVLGSEDVKVLLPAAGQTDHRGQNQPHHQHGGQAPQEAQVAVNISRWVRVAFLRASRHSLHLWGSFWKPRLA